MKPNMGDIEPNHGNKMDGKMPKNGTMLSR